MASTRTYGAFRKLAACGAIAASLLLAACGAEGLSIGNLTSSDRTVSFRIANDSGKSGDVVLWIEQDGLASCERVTEVRAHYSYTIRFYCPTLRSGRFTLRYGWAADYREKALVAERIE